MTQATKLHGLRIAARAIHRDYHAGVISDAERMQRLDNLTRPRGVFERLRCWLKP